MSLLLIKEGDQRQQKWVQKNLGWCWSCFPGSSYGGRALGDFATPPPGWSLEVMLGLGLDFALLLPISSPGEGWAGTCRWLCLPAAWGWAICCLRLRVGWGVSPTIISSPALAAQQSPPPSSPHSVLSSSALFSYPSPWSCFVPAAPTPRRTLAVFFFTLCVCFAL